MVVAGRLSPKERQEISSLSKSGRSTASLARRFNATNDTIRRWIREGKKQRPNWRDAAGRGRPALLNSTERSKAKRSAKAGHTVTQVAASLNNSRQQRVSTATVRRVLVGGRDPLVWGPKNRGRVLSDINKQARLEFAQSNLQAHSGSWIFADSKHFFCYHDGSGAVKYQWQDAGSKVTLPRSSNPTHLHFYAAVAKDQKSPLIFTAPTAPMGSKEKHSKEKFASRHFITVAKQLHKVVKQWEKPGRRRPIILDHASQHTSAKSKAAISDIGLNLKEGFPAQSWDINIIENVWGVLDTKMKGLPGRLPSTPDGWRRRLSRAWEQVDQATINKLVKQVKGRLRKIEEKEGAWLYSYDG